MFGGKRVHPLLVFQVSRFHKGTLSTGIHSCAKTRLLADLAEQESEAETQQLHILEGNSYRPHNDIFNPYKYIRPYPRENTGSRPLSPSQTRESQISSWVGDQRIPGVVCSFLETKSLSSRHFGFLLHCR